MADSNPDKNYPWLCLYLVEGLGNVAAKNLLEAYGSPEAIFSASKEEMETIEAVTPQISSNIERKRFALDPEKELKKIEAAGARIISCIDPEYPASLKEIYDPPMLLFAKGSSIPSFETFVAVVGSRNPTPYGIKMAQKIGKELAQRGIHVVSGLARGIDGAAQWGCIQGGGYTIGVLGTGVDVIYPASNKKLFQEVIEKGCVVSEFPLGTRPEPRNFPIRNRIISGISSGVVVVEAARKSGSLITASQALDQGREVFAVPGSALSVRSSGAHYLIKQGAKLVESAEDILEELGPMGRPGLQRGEGPGKSEKEEAIVEQLGKNARAIYEILSHYPIHLDELVRQTGLQPGAVSGLLVEMELLGLVKQLTGKMFVRI